MSDEGAEDESPPSKKDEPPAPARKKRRPKAAPRQESTEADAAADAEIGAVDDAGDPPAKADEKSRTGPYIPAFALKFPREPRLDALVMAFEAGDFARVRREGPVLAKETDDAAVRAAARELVRRLDPDPSAVYLLGIAAVLLAFLAGWYWLHPHGG